MFVGATKDLRGVVDDQRLQVAKKGIDRGSVKACKSTPPRAAVGVWRAMVRYAWVVAQSNARLVKMALRCAETTALAMLEPYFPHLREESDGKGEEWLGSAEEIDCRREIRREACVGVKKLRQRLRAAEKELKAMQGQLVGIWRGGRGRGRRRSGRGVEFGLRGSGGFGRGYD